MLRRTLSVSLTSSLEGYSETRKSFILASLEVARIQTAVFKIAEEIISHHAVLASVVKFAVAVVMREAAKYARELVARTL